MTEVPAARATTASGLVQTATAARVPTTEDLAAGISQLSRLSSATATALAATTATAGCQQMQLQGGQELTGHSQQMPRVKESLPMLQLPISSWSQTSSSSSCL